MSRPGTLAAALAAAVALAGCANPDTPAAGVPSTEPPGNAGEPDAPAPPPPITQRSAAPERTAAAAVEGFSRLYTNWSYRTLGANERTLAATSVGAARLQARQDAASARGRQLARERVWNRGQILAVTPDRGRSGWWLIVTREQTVGSGEYEALPPGLHLTLALAVRVRGGWAVSEWQPQS